nr:Chain E, MUC1 Peptide Fragment [Homo sapiens]5T6P_F Chain F, MUC1 Peptide Fragment [Homo sapiens]5T78_E Chain E, MUC1 Glycopeptide [Homo sapiens]5T78_F Chain F, MUC1 Glycopeptide [Homo sapiens]
APDTRPAP